MLSFQAARQGWLEASLEASLETLLVTRCLQLIVRRAQTRKDITRREAYDRSNVEFATVALLYQSIQRY